MNEADTNEWVEYLEVIERRRAGERLDLLFRSPRCRYHANGVELSEEERARISASFEDALGRMAE